MPPATIEHVRSATARVARRLSESVDHFTELDQAIGDGDLGVTVAKVAKALLEAAESTTGTDIGKYLVSTGLALNKAAPSTMGTLLATALMRAGKVATGHEELSDSDVAEMLDAASQGMQDRGKAKVGDKTILDAMIPSGAAFSEAIRAGRDRLRAGQEALEAAKAGRDAVTPKRSRIGRAGWVGQRTEGKVDPGCEVWVTVLSAIFESSP